jgi:tRNA pseudouridine32 synthase/23S rRNA pseudouridine746 synthase
MTDETDTDDRQLFEVGREHKGLSLFDFLDAVAGPLDRKLLLSRVREQAVLLNGVPTSMGATLRVGDLVELELPATELARPPRREISVLHESPGLLVADKPSGMPFSESRRGGESVLDRLGERWQGLRAVHRLDKETSGVVVAALGRASEAALLAALQAGQARVEYLAVVRGALPAASGRCDVPLGKARRSDVRLQPDPGHGDPCATAWRVQEELRGFTVLAVQPEGAGRSHQVRAHLAAEGYPVLCDRLYGEDDRLMLSQLKLDYRSKRGRPERPILARPALHAARFVHGDLRVESPLPEELSVLLAQLRRLRPPD